MAGDWIKVEHATATKPEVCMGAELLGVSRREMIGICVDYWIWLDANLGEGCNGLVTQVSRKSLEDVLHCPGFAAILERMQWASFDDEARTLVVTNWDRHNGTSAKSRALTRNRVKRLRSGNVTLTPLIEKRREEKSLSTKTLMSSSQANSDAAKLLEFLNAKTGRQFRATPTTLKPILARLKEFTFDECRGVIVQQCKKWGGDDKMAAYLRPITLFGATNFAQYVGDVPTPEEVSHANQNLS
jgi:uncharacterized phage protein (TIGR02220 family)